MQEFSDHNMSKVIRFSQESCAPTDCLPHVGRVQWFGLVLHFPIVSRLYYPFGRIIHHFFQALVEPFNVRKVVSVTHD